MFMICSIFLFERLVLKDPMDWTPYIDRSRQTLLRLIGVVFAMIGLDERAFPETVTRAMHSKVLHTLRPAESGLRRLIVVFASELERRGYIVPKRAARPLPKKPIPRRERVLGRPSFRLIDPRKYFEWIGTKKRPRYTKGAPNISFFDGYDRRVIPPEPSLPMPDDPVDATSLCNRLIALKAGLEDIPTQAKRMLRLKARGQNGVLIKAPMRPGLPPGWRRNGREEIDEVLRECHRLAKWARDATEPG